MKDWVVNLGVWSAINFLLCGSTILTFYDQGIHVVLVFSCIFTCRFGFNPEYQFVLAKFGTPFFLIHILLTDSVPD